ncbi:cytochrome o ubiquinol oxidase subunit III [Maioricimonas rarisocia]|uniref:Cytochrome o ubiquinol oxidase subunit III n=1 Tax=Maioricimonas rarisocia TaxID=2528026 RepID=A0A517ZFG6_9PLAN|nr:cytochrome c oxidase subunit 3 [Maioricimonas rarisocia]QDU41179.1 cytochrome o ubiquinol oxidase subunit III [Maioricimonas rarisocia]
MSTTTAPSSEVAPSEHSDGGHDDHGHDPFLAHHFGSAKQQFDAGKFGMWLFLVTEILFFSGLFCAYAVYRSTHPEAFANADQYLDPMLGAANTAVLIFSSLTMAWAVRAAQLGQKQLLVRLLTITLSCASIFLGVKAVEYSHKWDLGILWASNFNPQAHAAHSPALLVLSIPAMITVVVTAILFGVGKSRKSEIMSKFWGCLLIAALAYFGGVGLGLTVPVIEGAITGEAAHASAEAGHHAAEGAHHAAAAEEAVEHAAGHATEHAAGDAVATTAAKSGSLEAAAIEQAAIDRTYTGIFFSIYYVMTGLHGFHILIGMGVIAWLLYRSLLGHFGPRYFGPVDFVGLYWHLVDLIWIYLFPLLYLIG